MVTTSPVTKRRQCKAYAPDHQPKAGMEQPAHQNTAHHNGHRIHALARHKRDHDGDEGEGCALHDGQLCPHWPKGDGLQQCRHTCKEHRHLQHVNQVGEIGRARAKAKPRSPRHDDGGRHIGNEHGQHMLNPQRDGLV
jgi:hypothetical protein